ncbi:hypothetical protein COO60DRAFT_1569881 [Scenedesmus sp. NREL 46B-D3]|nr:hypothetical protein COO60DRAFT_1569881 [Scenedesmus sp. NREL 46B-D3]
MLVLLVLLLVLRCCAWVLRRHCRSCGCLCRVLLHVFRLMVACRCSWVLLLMIHYGRLLLQTRIACWCCHRQGLACCHCNRIDWRLWCSAGAGVTAGSLHCWGKIMLLLVHSRCSCLPCCWCCYVGHLGQHLPSRQCCCGVANRHPSRHAVWAHSCRHEAGS